MKRLNLVVFLTIFVALPCLFLSFSPTADKVELPEHVRYSVISDSGKKNLKIMEAAMAKMRTMDCQEPFSWFFQGAIHGVPASSNFFDCCSKDATNLAWENCTHRSPDEPDYTNAKIHFLTWHRLYTAHFEEVIRKVSKRPDFTLPYWEYDDNRNPENKLLPEFLRNTSSSLYTPCRNKRLNNSKPLPRAVKSCRNDTCRTYMLTSTNEAFNNTFKFYDFTDILEFKPHGLLHNYFGGYYGTDNPLIRDGVSPDCQCQENTCETGNCLNKNNYDLPPGFMWNPATAGFDPVFWLHHSNIDRLFEKWQIENVNQQKARANYKKEFEANPWDYRFYSENDINKMITYPIEEAYRKSYYASKKDYMYDKYESEMANYITKSKKYVEEEIQGTVNYSQVVSEMPLASTGRNVSLPANSTAIVTLNTDVAFNNFRSKKSTEPRRVIDETLTLEVEVEFSDIPDGLIGVAVRKKGENEFKEVGLMSFFGVGHNHGGDDMDHMNHGSIEQTFTFNLEDELGTAITDADIEVEFVSLTGDKTDNIIIDNISLTKEFVVKNKGR